MARRAAQLEIMPSKRSSPLHFPALKKSAPSTFLLHPRTRQTIRGRLLLQEVCSREEGTRKWGKMAEHGGIRGGKLHLDLWLPPGTSRGNIIHLPGIPREHQGGFHLRDDPHQYTNKRRGWGIISYPTPPQLPGH